MQRERAKSLSSYYKTESKSYHRFTSQRVSSVKQNIVVPSCQSVNIVHYLAPITASTHPYVLPSCAVKSPTFV